MSLSLRSLSLFGGKKGGLCHSFVCLNLYGIQPSARRATCNSFPSVWSAMENSASFDLCTTYLFQFQKQPSPYSSLVSNSHVHNCSLHTGHCFASHVYVCIPGWRIPALTTCPCKAITALPATQKFLRPKAFPGNKDERTHRVPDTEPPSMGARAKGPRKRSRPTLWSPL